jgi:hypothetical protein
MANTQRRKLTDVELAKILIGLHALRDRVECLHDRLQLAYHEQAITTSYELYGFKDEGRILTLGHCPSLDRYDRICR